jgi:Xaa-Pro dipeptidase
MTIGVGGSTREEELARMKPMRDGIVPTTRAEREARIARAQALMKAQGVQALYLDVSSNLYYFTGIRLTPTERLHGAIIPAEGSLIYLSPAFEEPKTQELISIPGEIRCWEEHEDPTALVIETLRGIGLGAGTLAIDPMTPFFTVDGLRRAENAFTLSNGAAITGACRAIKTPAEIAFIQRAMEITLEVQKAAARILVEGITTTEMQSFLAEAHRKLGAQLASGPGAVQFGEATAYPHGVPYPQTLRKGDMVLIDTGAFIEGYRSDITRTYVFGEPTARDREIWNLEKAAQAAGFAAAKLGAPCEAVDIAARAVIAAGGFGPDYATPGLPHRTGHGIGLDVHEEPYLVRGDRTKLAPGMCFSNEPTICIYGEFGIRLEDHFHMTTEGARWFTQPCHSVDDPFGYEA